jgi:hypothetical protein
MFEYSRGRGLYGGLRTPLHTIRGAISRIPNLLTTGVQVTQSATSNLVTWTAGAWDYVSGTNNLTVHHVLYQYPYYAVASRQVDGATVTFTVPMAHYDGAAYYNGTGGISINSQPFGWESKYDTNSSLGNVSAIRCLNTNGTWQDDVVTTIFEDDGSPLTCRWQVPNLSLPEHLVAAFDAANATFEGANGWVNDITAWDTITVRVVTEYGVASTQCGRIDWDGGSSTWVQDSTYLISGTDRAYAIAQQSDMVLSPRAATPNELNHLFTPQKLTVNCLHSSPGMRDSRLELDSLYEQGVAFDFVSLSTPMARDAFRGTRPPVPTNSLLGLVGAKVFGVNPGSPRSVTGGTWSDVKVELIETQSSDVSEDTWGHLNTLTGNDLGEATLPGLQSSNWASPHVWQRHYKFNGLSDATSAEALGWINSQFGAAFGHRSNNGVISLGPVSQDLNASYGMVSHSMGAQFTYVYPDEPKYKMTYRPWRTIADASIAKELRMLFANDGEDPTFAGGPLGIKCLGTPAQFRFADLLDAGQPQTFILEPATSKTRLISPSYRSVLTFTKQSLLDPATQRHALPDVIDELNQGLMTKGVQHISGASGSPVLDRNTIREVQLGRQYQRLG